MSSCDDKDEEFELRVMENGGYTDEDINKSKLIDLVQHFAQTTFKTNDNNPINNSIQEKCLVLFSRDYKFSILNNSSGNLCSHYPSKIILLEGYRFENEEERLVDNKVIKELIHKCRIARCRSRFIVPVILFENKHICRSATLASAPELYGRSSFDWFFPGEKRKNFKEEAQTPLVEEAESEWDLLNKIRTNDVKLLKELNVKYIVDLMVEQKKVKFGVNVTSSEKVDRENRYSDFQIASVPYPGCEFFRDFKNNCYSGEGIYFDWNQGFVDANFCIPPSIPHPKNIEWKKYKSWDLVVLTKNYLLFILQLLREGDSSVLIHCISGWDRTPLFISLLRLSLWADGYAHKSLSAAEILYLTIGYDWLLFGHDLEDRLTKGEEVFFFCFNFLKHIVSDEFSMNIERSNSLHNLKPRHRTLSFTQFDDILIDSPNRSRTSSLASLSSISSVASERLSCCESISEEQEYSRKKNDSLSRNDSISSRTGSISSVGSSSFVKTGHNSSFSATCSNHPSRPCSATEPSSIPMPCSRPLDQRTSSLCGSWQLISGTGSPHGTASANGSLPLPRSLSSSSLSETFQETVSERQMKLEAVRSLFHNVYAGAVGYGNKQDQNTGLSGILDQVTSKMIKATWITSV